MHGRVLQLFVAAGESVAPGQRLAIIEAMKMEHTLHAPFAGAVHQVAVAAGRSGCGRRRDHADRARRERDNVSSWLSSHQTLRRLRFGPRSRGLDQAKAQRQAQTRRKARTHPSHPHGAQARGRTDRRRLALLGDPRRDHVPPAHPRRAAVPRQGRRRALRHRARSQSWCWWRRARIAPSRAGGIWRTPMRRATSTRRRRERPPMPEKLRRELRELGLM